MLARSIRFGAVALAGMLVLTSCAQGSATKSQPSGSASGPVTISYMNFGANGGHEQDLAAIATAFHAANPDITVNIETVPYADYFTKLQTAVAAGSAADAFELNYENFVTYTSNGVLAELPGVDGAVYKPSLLQAFAKDGKQYGLPESFSDVVLFYNADLFKAAGVAEPTGEWTWADEKAAAEKLTNKGKKVWGDYQPVTFYEFYKALAQAGGSFFNADHTATAFNSPEGIKAAEWLVNKPGTVMPTTADGAGTPDWDTKQFQAGKLAMWHSGIWMFDGLQKAPFNWNIVVEPGDTTKASAMFANAAVVNAKSPNAAAAQKWITYLTSSDEMVKTRLDSSWELPPIADQGKLAAYLSKGKPTNRQAVFAALDHVVLPPVIASQQEMQDAITKELGAAAAGRKTVKQALTDAAATVDGLIK